MWSTDRANAIGDSSNFAAINWKLVYEGLFCRIQYMLAETATFVCVSLKLFIEDKKTKKTNNNFNNKGNNFFTSNAFCTNMA